MRRLCAGDSTAWVQLIDHWSPRLYSYILYNVEREPDTQTLLQSIFAEIVQMVVGSLKIANLTILLFSTAHQHVLRYREKHPHPLSPSHPQLLSADSPDAQRMIRFWKSFGKFAPEWQQVLLLYYLCEVSVPEISQIVGAREEELRRVLQQANYYLLRT